MVRKKLYPLWHLLHAARLLGLDPAELLDKAGLPPGLATDIAASGCSEEQRKLIGAIMQTGEGRDFPLRFALSFQHVPCGVYYYAFRTGRSFGDALQMLIRYKGDTAPEMLFGQLKGNGYEVRVVHQTPSATSLGSVMFFAWLREAQRGNFLKEAKPLRVTVSNPIPDATLYERQLQCAIEIGSGDTIVFPREALAYEPFASYPRVLGADGRGALGPCVPSAEEKDATFASLVSAVLREHLAQERITAKEVATYLATSVRTLQRRLGAEGISLTALHERVRRERSAELLLDSSIRVAEVAGRLGYADASTFTKAFKRWYNVTPGQFRAERASSRA
jgi:AraC-like DNA-binding protein